MENQFKMVFLLVCVIGIIIISPSYFAGQARHRVIYVCYETVADLNVWLNNLKNNEDFSDFNHSTHHRSREEWKIEELPEKYIKYRKIIGEDVSEYDQENPLFMEGNCIEAENGESIGIELFPGPKFQVTACGQDGKLMKTLIAKTP